MKIKASLRAKNLLSHLTSQQAGPHWPSEESALTVLQRDYTSCASAPFRGQAAVSRGGTESVRHVCEQVNSHTSGI